jgi:GT2 family glycosyltransferase
MSPDIVFGFMVFKPTAHIEPLLNNMYQYIKKPIIIVDCTQNKKDKETLGHIVSNSLSWSDIIVVENHVDNLMGSFNTLIDKAMEIGASYLVIQNFDILYMGDDFCGKAMGIMDMDKKIGILCPFTNSTAWPFMYQELPSIQGMYDWYAKRNIPLRYRRVFTGDYINMIIRLSMIPEIGKFDDVNFGKYGALAELDYGYRMEQNGYYWAVTDTLFIYHFGRACWGHSVDAYIAHLEDAKSKFHLKYGDKLSEALMRRERGPQ